MSWAIRYEDTDEYLKAWEGPDEYRPFVFATKKEALAKICKINNYRIGHSLVPVEVDLPIRDEFKFHNFKRGKR